MTYMELDKDKLYSCVYEYMSKVLPYKNVVKAVFMTGREICNEINVELFDPLTGLDTQYVRNNKLHVLYGDGDSNWHLIINLQKGGE